MTPSRLNTLSLAGWAALVWGLPFSHAAMSIGTAWLGVLAVVGLCTSPEARRRLTSSSSWRPLLCLAALLGWSTLSMVWTSDASWGWRVLGLQWPILVLMLAWPALGMDDRDHAKVHGWVLGSAGLAMAVCLGWGAWQLSQGEVLEGRGLVALGVPRSAVLVRRARVGLGSHVQADVATGLVFLGVGRLCGGHGFADQRGAPSFVLGLDRAATRSRHLAAAVPRWGARADCSGSCGRRLGAPAHPSASAALANHHVLGQSLPAQARTFGL